MTTTNYVFMIAAAGLTVTAFSQEQPVVPVPVQSAASARSAAEVIGDAAKLMQSVDGVLKSITDPASAADAVAILEQVTARQNALSAEWRAVAETLSEEEIEKWTTSVDVDALEASLAPEVDRLVKAGLFGNKELGAVLIGVLPYRYHRQLGVNHEEVNECPVKLTESRVETPVQSADFEQFSVLGAPIRSVESQTVAMLLGDWSKMRVNADRLLKSIRDGASATSAMDELRRIRADYDRLHHELMACGPLLLANLSVEDCIGFIEQADTWNQAGASLRSELNRIEASGGFGNEDLKSLLKDFDPDGFHVSIPEANTEDAQKMNEWMQSLRLSVSAKKTTSAQPAAPDSPAAAATRPTVEVLGDWVKLMQTMETLLKATTDGSSAVKAATDLQQLKALQEKLNEELKLAQNSDQANLPQEELAKIFQKLQELQNVANALNTEVERIEKAGFFGNDALKGLWPSDAPVEVEEEETVVEEAPVPAPAPAK